MKITCILLFILCLLPGPFTLAQTWNTLGDGAGSNIFYYVKDFQVWGNKLYVAGAFPTMAGLTVNGITSFDGQQFDSLSSGAYGTPNDLTIYNNQLIAVGMFSTMGNVPNTRNVAAWDGEGWMPLGSGVGLSAQEVKAAAVYNGDLYVGGNITYAGSGPVGRIAKWNGSTWSNVGGGFTGNCTVYSMAVYNGSLYVGGQITLPNSSNSYYYGIVRWNGTQWDSVGGKTGIINALLVDTVRNVLYAGGPVTDIGGVSVYQVAEWNDTIWKPMGHCPTNGVAAMALLQGDLYAGGYASSYADTTLARWDGINWHPILPKPNNQVLALGTYDGNLYVGGYFDSIGVMPFNHIACYGNNCPQGVGINEMKGEGRIDFKVFPNPTKSELNLEIITDEVDPSGHTFIVTIRNSLGQTKFQSNIDNSLRIDVSQYNKGIYFIELCDQGRRCYTRKVIID